VSVRFERAIVVGASSGIGAAIAKRLADEGAQVAILGRRAAELEAVAGGRMRTYVHDVEDTDAVPALWERIVADLGGVDTLVYASGVMPALAEHEYSFEKDRQMVAVNLLGAMAWMGLAAARFEAQKSGSLVGISSIAGERGRRGNPGYCTSKAAMTSYLESLRNRCSRYGVNVVTVKPGFVDTAMVAGRDKLLWLIPPEQAAKKALALARRGGSASGFVPRRWWLVALIVRLLPSFVFRRLNF
jgi:NAD(P)-dependent dehydrogenase (short-subunit alcohol dehydrogenase family)